MSVSKSVPSTGEAAPRRGGDGGVVGDDYSDNRDMLLFYCVGFVRENDLVHDEDCPVLAMR